LRLLGHHVTAHILQKAPVVAAQGRLQTDVLRYPALFFSRLESNLSSIYLAISAMGRYGAIDANSNDQLIFDYLQLHQIGYSCSERGPTNYA
jgi:hypothetical protein